MKTRKVNHTSAKRVRGSNLGIPFEGKSGKFNAITDVAGVTVGHVTLIDGIPRTKNGKGIQRIRTGVTAILPRDKNQGVPVFGAWFALNGNGEMTGTAWIEESGQLEGPILLTNTASVGVVRDAVLAYRVRKNGKEGACLPVVAETDDGDLNDAYPSPIKSKHVRSALKKARSGRIDEGNVGGGTGMICHEFKGGIGTASRCVHIGRKNYTVGVLVQAAAVTSPPIARPSSRR